MTKRDKTETQIQEWEEQIVLIKQLIEVAEGLKKMEPNNTVYLDQSIINYKSYIVELESKITELKSLKDSFLLQTENKNVIQATPIN